MKILKLNRWKILTPILVWWLIFITLSAYNYNGFQLLNIVGFLFLAIVPGLLMMLAMKIKGLPFWGYLSLTVAFSLLELILMALIGNTFFPFAGIARPLDKPTLLFELYPLIAILAAVVWFRVKTIEIPIKRCLIFDNPRDFIVAFVPLIFVILAIFGTISLNDGGGSILTMIMLGGIGIYIFVLIHNRDTTDENATLTAIFFMGLSLLLMNSMRGWYITGHDIQREYKVFQLAKDLGLWSIAAFRDPYNACLSITILPTIFSNLLQVPDPYIFKFFFQIFFAFCPVITYLIASQWVDRRIAILSGIYFMAFGPFYTDMSFLVRQEIAFLFYGLMLYVVFEKKLTMGVRRGLFMLMGIGVILSHYSTTYTVLIIFGLAVISRPLFIRLIAWAKEKNLFKQSALLDSQGQGPTGKPGITVIMVATLLALSFLWTGIITQTSNNVTDAISQTIAAVKGGFGGDNRSIDATSLLTFGKPDQNQELQDYIKTVVDPIRASSTPGTYFDQDTYSQYKFVALPDETLPVNAVGRFLGRFGFDVATDIPIFGQLLAKLMEILSPLGILYLIFRNKIIKHINVELYLLAIYCLVFIAMNIILPVLSTEYGIFRAMQQSMFILAPIIVLGSVMVGGAIARIFRPMIKKYDFNRAGNIFSVVLLIVFFLYSTAFISQLFGGNTAVLYLSDTGRYYDNYLLQDVEIAGINWLSDLVVNNPSLSSEIQYEVQTDRYSEELGSVQGDRYSQNKFPLVTDLDYYNDIFPGLVRKDSYIFLGDTNITKQRATILYNGDQVTYPYPLQFLEENKNLIYNDGGSEVYK